jgi:hypothetical protein
MKKLVLVLAAATGFYAQADLKLEDAFAGVTVNKPACFTRTYGSTHLRNHPKQTVRRIKIKLRQWKFSRQSEPTPMLAIQVKRKGENKVWTNNIACMDNRESKSVLCAVECDGGSVEILSRNAQGELVLKNNGVLLYGGCGADQGQETIILETRKGGDDVFQLKQDDEQACADVSEEAH